MESMSGGGNSSDVGPDSFWLVINVIETSQRDALSVFVTALHHYVVLAAVRRIGQGIVLRPGWSPAGWNNAPSCLDVPSIYAKGAEVAKGGWSSSTWWTRTMWRVSNFEREMMTGWVATMQQTSPVNQGSCASDDGERTLFVCFFLCTSWQFGLSWEGCYTCNTTGPSLCTVWMWHNWIHIVFQAPTYDRCFQISWHLTHLIVW